MSLQSKFTYTESGSSVVSLNGATGVTAGIEGYPEAVSVNGSVITVSKLRKGNYILSVTTIPDANHNAVSINTIVTVNPIIITTANFNNYFDVNGVLISNIDDFMFSGAFNNLNLTIKNPVTLSSQNAAFVNVKFNIESDNVTVSNMIFNYIGEDSVINVKDVSNFKLENSIIMYTGQSNNYVINVTNAGNVELNNNLIQATSKSYIHGVIISADNFTIDNNTILINGVENACGINILGPSTGIVKNNYLDINASNNIYSINTNPSTGLLKVSYVKNSINAEAYFVVGIYDDSEEIKENSFNLKANYAIGIVVLSNANIEGNEMVLNTTDSGDEENPENITYSTGIQVNNSANISNNKIDSTSKSINVVGGNSNIAGNELVGSVSIESDGNTISGNIITPTEGEHAIDLGSSSGNTVTTNAFYSDSEDVNELIKSEGENTIANNTFMSVVNVGDLELEFVYTESATTTYTIKYANNITAEVINHTEANIVIGENTITVSNLTPGVYVLNVTTVPVNETYSPDTALINITVVKASSSIEITSIENGTYNTTEPNITLNVNNQTDILLYNITQNGEEIASAPMIGIISVLLNLKPGTYNITYTNPENEYYTSSSTTAEFTINKASSSIEITSVENGTYNTTIPIINYDIINQTDILNYNITQNGKEIASAPMIGIISVL